MNIATKQVDKIAISEELFHEVVEEHIPVLIKKQSALPPFLIQTSAAPFSTHIIL